jgi:hypothetical protein
MPARTPLLVALVALLSAGPAAAQKPKIKIEEARIGLPPGKFAGDRSGGGRSIPILKKNVWAPIYLKLEMLAEYDGAAQLKIEADDADELRTALYVPLATTFAGRLPGSKVEPTEFGSVPYVRVGDRQGQVTLTILSAPTDGSRPRELSEPVRFGSGNKYLEFRNISSYVVLSLGSRLPGFDLPAPQNKTATSQTSLRDGRVLTAAVTNVREMPDQWFGYNAADLVVLTTGSAPPEFLDELFDDQISGPFKDRRDALLEWVRRGGKLVVSAGSQAAKLSQYGRLMEVLPATINRDPPTRGVNELILQWRIGGSSGTPLTDNLRPKTDTFPVARLNLNPARPAQVLLAEKATDQPLVVQAPYGLGRITVVAFDLDQSPFTDAANRPQFWDWLVREGGSAQASLATQRQANTYGYGYSYGYSEPDTEDEYLGAVRTHVDTFDGVPVVSFGWVALFIVLYTLLIGPVEYLILKKVFGRLELTWITFPLIVVTVSAAAYFTAYAIKGSDLKLNKVDVVDVDVGGGRVYGRSWFTVFSPRIDSYTIAVEPNDGWTVTPANSPAPPTLVGWMAGGRGTGGGGIVSRGYTYHTDRNARVIADGLERVPIQVWSTKAFTANWSGYVDKGTPLIDADLYHPPGKAEAFEGTIVNNLPVRTLRDPVLIYAGQAYKLPALTPGQKVRVSTNLEKDQQWLAANVTTSGVSSGYQPQYGYQPKQVTTTSNLSLWGALFHEKAAGSGGGLMNASLRELDQSWRLTAENRHEAIILAKTEGPPGVTATEELMAGPTPASPTKLWLKGLPGGPEGREPIPGTLRQETYVRVYIPVQPKPKGAGK